uniref:FAS1 domain-containing protein n=1 Tax=Timema cristinae TaxID=61476 RepID=A0A7R9D2D8_TIMCR|nr:unnamed protein product [Timema cristinae]
MTAAAAPKGQRRLTSSALLKSITKLNLRINHGPIMDRTCDPLEGKGDLPGASRRLRGIFPKLLEGRGAPVVGRHEAVSRFELVVESGALLAFFLCVVLIAGAPNSKTELAQLPKIITACLSSVLYECVSNKLVRLCIGNCHIDRAVDCIGYYVEWQGEWIHVFRPDVECTNGIIHVIDSVFLKAGDVRVSGGGVAVPLLAPQLAMLLMAKWLLLYSEIGYPKPLIDNQISIALSRDDYDPPKIVEDIPLTTQYHPGLQCINTILKCGYKFLTSSTQTQNLSSSPRVTFKWSPNLHNILVHPKLPDPKRIHEEEPTTKGSHPCGNTRCSTCGIHLPATSFNSKLFNLLCHSSMGAKELDHAWDTLLVS